MGTGGMMGAPPTKSTADNALDDEVVAGICHVHANAEIKFPVGREIQVNGGKYLLRLFIPRIEM